ncbi:hypothetical protein T02_11998 [Trichinella nativa]|uniref:Uncharacterized protein n=2 Tax=Trichinella TaxID=6333 RepID=A0A0V1L0I2_9BILA|nr:hypothetical protein T03_13952 [Trichinella britovi]KRZ52870.1 hypothetical protein T02_11998 [Trichinella nativa]
MTSQVNIGKEEKITTPFSVCCLLFNRRSYLCTIKVFIIIAASDNTRVKFFELSNNKSTKK